MSPRIEVRARVTASGAATLRLADHDAVNALAVKFGAPINALSEAGRPRATARTALVSALTAIARAPVAIAAWSHCAAR